jgi:hypothetical protein
MHVHVRALSLLLLILLSPSAGLAMIVLDEHFDGDSANFVASSGWSNSYCDDGWRTDLNDGVIASLDAGCSECECNFLVQTDGVNDCIDSDALDNHIQVGNSDWQNYSYSLRFRNDDDDAMGILFRYVNSANFYLFVLAQTECPTAQGCVEAFAGARLIRVRQDIGGVLLKEVAGLTYETGKEHSIRVTVNDRHIKLEFDHNGDGKYGANEVFFDQDDDPLAFIPAGSVGLYAFNNGAHEEDGQESPCATGGCWFDDAMVDLLSPNNQNCGDIGWEGTCEGNTLKYCDVQGDLQTDKCGAGNCCRWVDAQGYFTCVPGEQCETCIDDCEAAFKWCSSNLTHSVTCGQADGDDCLEPLFTPCPANSVCNPVTGECETPCQPQCEGLECGDNGCGGSCGSCGADQQCVNGTCQADLPGLMGDPCQSANDCITMMCVEYLDEKLCSKACSGGANCPLGFVCEEVSVSGMTLEGCVPSGECVPDCTGKVCGSNGCDGSCGSCDSGFACKGGQCKSEAGASCEAADDCASGLCIAYQSGIFCSAPCSTDEGCPEEWHCNPWIDPSTPNICSPKNSMVAHETCSEVADCVSSCPPNNDACVTSCFFFGAAPAQLSYAGLLICTKAECFPSCGDDNGCISECLLDACFQVFAECFPGTTSCSEAVDCMAACGSNESCQQKCYDEAFPAGKKQLNELLECFSTICDDEIGSDCFDAAIDGPCAEAWSSCSQPCTPLCDELECGNDGCGSTCGECPSGHVCEAGSCFADCEANCDNKDCGDDGCGGECGMCSESLICVAGTCVTEGECVPQAEQHCVGDSLFWFDNCGEQGELASACVYGCQDDACVEPPNQADTVTFDDSYSAPDTGGVVFSATKGSGGCSDTSRGTSWWSFLLSLAALLAIRALRRSKHA